VEVRRASVASATWLVRADTARRLVAASGLQVYEPVRGRALCALAFVRYEDSDLGAYNEVAVAVVVRPAGEGTRPGAYIHQLPVDQAFTLEAGRSIWGFPKWLSQSDLNFEHRQSSCVLRDGDDHILTLAVRRSRLPLPGREVTMDAYSHLDGVVRRTPWVMRVRGVRGRLGGATLVLGERHPMAAELRSLGLRRPVMTSTVTQMSARFEDPEVVRTAAP
jgi:hypothetical protein